MDDADYKEEFKYLFDNEVCIKANNDNNININKGFLPDVKNIL